MVKLLVLILLFVCRSFSQEFGVKAYTDTTVYMIGDHIKLHFDITHNKGISFAEPAFRDSIQNIDIISVNAPLKEEKEGKTFTRYEIILSRYDSSDIKIAPITFYYWYGEAKDRVAFLSDKFAVTDTSLKSARSNEVNFRVNAVKVNVQEDIKDIKGPVKLPPDWRIILLFILAGLIVLSAVFYYYKKLKKKRANEIRKVPILPPHITALNSLKELENKKLWQKGLIKDFHSEVTGIIRKYFEDRFNLPALELTTDETITLLKNTNNAEGILDDTEVFFRNADLVKFAKFIPLNDVNEMMMKKAYGIVEKTVPVKEAEAPEISNVN